MSTNSDSHGKIFSIVIGMVVIGLFFLYLKRSGQLDEIRESLSALSGK